MLISLFSGMRASELVQLKLDSIRHERGVFVIAVEEETKNSGSQRIIPLHSFLIERGLEALVAELRAKRTTHLFPDWYRKGIDAKSRAKIKGTPTLNHYFPRFIPSVLMTLICLTLELRTLARPGTPSDIPSKPDWQGLASHAQFRTACAVTPIIQRAEHISTTHRSRH